MHPHDDRRRGLRRSRHAIQTHRGVVTGATALEVELRGMIASDGPMTVARYMALCLGHPRHGYYITRDPLGARGDFTTAPEISQVFGELLGLWSAAVWQSMGYPHPCALAELGPGRGTLMADALRAASVVPAFRQAISVHLVETSPVLHARQRAALEVVDVDPQWHETVGSLPNGPLIVLANEFFDAMPIQQAIKTEKGWHERVVGLNADGRFAFAANPVPMPGLGPGLLKNEDPLNGAIWEWRDDAILQQLCECVVSGGGAILIIDYGHGRSATGDTLQAVRAHSFVDPLDAPGECDLTAHVDFAALARSAARCGARVHGPVSQGDFLRSLGIETRAQVLKAAATRDQSKAIDTALARLTGNGAGEMGEMFKVIALSHPDLRTLPGFETLPSAVNSS